MTDFVYGLRHIHGFMSNLIKKSWTDSTLDVYSNSEFDFSLQTSASKASAFDLRLSGSMQIERNRVTYFYVIPISNIVHTKAGPWLSCTSQVLLNT